MKIESLYTGKTIFEITDEEQIKILKRFIFSMEFILIQSEAITKQMFSEILLLNADVIDIIFDYYADQKMGKSSYYKNVDVSLNYTIIDYNGVKLIQQFLSDGCPKDWFQKNYNFTKNLWRKYIYHNFMIRFESI